MAAVSALRMREMQGPKIALQLLVYPECKLPFETLAGEENCTGLYLETQRVFLFAWNMLPTRCGDPTRRRKLHITGRVEGKGHADFDITPLNADKTLSAGHGNFSKAFVITNVLDPLRDTGFAYAKKLKAVNDIS